jgi:hypothetical protein
MPNSRTQVSESWAEDAGSAEDRAAAWAAQLAFDRLADRIRFCLWLCGETLADLEAGFFHRHGAPFVQKGCVYLRQALALLCNPLTATEAVCEIAERLVEAIEAVEKNE